MTSFIFLFIFFVALLIFLYGPKEKAVIEVGKIAPSFKLRDENNQSRSLSEFKGKKVMLYFYPKDNTPICTSQACTIRDKFELFKQNNIVVLGINYDLPATHKIFKEKQNLQFTLLSDEEKNVSKKYGAHLSPLNNFYPERKTVLIDEQGKIIHIFDKVSVQNHVEEVLKIFGIPSGEKPDQNDISCTS